VAVADEFPAPVAGVLDLWLLTDLAETGDAHALISPSTRFNLGRRPSLSGGSRHSLAAAETFRGVGAEVRVVYGSRIVSGLSAVFAGMALLFAVFGVVYNLVFFGVAILFGAVSYFMWYHASGRFFRRLYRSVEDRAAVEETRGGFGAGPREEWTPPRDEQRQRARAATEAAARQAGRRAAAGQRAPGGGRAGRGGRGGRRVDPRADDGPTLTEAYDVLGLDEDADADAVKRAYRERVKEVHPDSPDGDEESFKEVQAAYERLSGD